MHYLQAIRTLKNRKKMPNSNFWKMVNYFVILISLVSKTHAFEFLRETRILYPTQDWEIENSNGSTIGYPSAVFNNYGIDADFQLYLFYSVHNPPGGIGVGKINQKTRKIENKKLIKIKNLNSYGVNTHISSPFLVRDFKNERWLLYFHYYRNRFDKGFGHQNTAVAVSKSLISEWQILKKTYEKNSYLDMFKINGTWMNSQATYAAFCFKDQYYSLVRATSGKFNRGSWTQYPTDIALYVSKTGKNFYQIKPGPLPVIREGKNNVIWPLLITARHLLWGERLGKNKGATKLHGATHSSGAIDGEANNIVDIFSNIKLMDGALSIVEQGDILYVFSGVYMYEYQRLHGEEWPIEIC